jgi:hypothetical protein
MTARFGLACALILAAAPARAAADDSNPTADQLRAAVAKALPPLEKGAVGHREQRTCFACHSQGLPILALTTARTRGLSINEEELSRQLQFIADFLGRNRASYLKGKGQGGQVDTAGYALLALELGGWQADETTAAVAEYLLLYQQKADHWRANSRRPPSEASPFTTSYVGLRGLQSFGTPQQQDRIAARTKQIRTWLLATPAKDNEDRVFRLRALALAGAPAAAVQSAATELLQSQRDDGGWSQLDAPPAEDKPAKPERPDFTGSDAYATGTVLVALHDAGKLAASDPAYQRGLRYLLRTQRDDGTWLVRSRSKPFQKYFETGFPHGQDQFISSAATAWATTALALALPTP